MHAEDLDRQMSTGQEDGRKENGEDEKKMTDMRTCVSSSIMTLMGALGAAGKIRQREEDTIYIYIYKEYMCEGECM